MLEALRDGIDGSGYLRQNLGDSSGDGSVLGIDDAEHVECGKLVDVLGEWVAGFGEESGEIHRDSMMHDCDGIGGAKESGSRGARMPK